MGIVVLIVWLGFLAGCLLAGLLLAYARFGVLVLTGETAAELAVMVTAFAAILYGLPLAAAALGIPQ